MVEIKCPYPGCRDQPFSRRSNLRRHLNVMHRSKYKCNYPNCSKVFKTNKELLMHQKLKHRLRCQLCPEVMLTTFKNQTQLSRHIRLVHERQVRHNVHFCNSCQVSFKSKTDYQLHNVKNHQRGGGFGFELHNTAMDGDHEDYRKEINSDHAPEVLFSDEYYPQIIQFLEDQHAKLSHYKYNFVLTVIYESPIDHEDNESYRKSE